jgi:hypothetical protein
MGARGIAANMWALLLDKDPGHRAAAGDLAVDVVDRKLKKAGVTPIDAEVAKPAKREQIVKKEKQGAIGCSNQAPATVNCRQVQINGVGEDNKEPAAAVTVPDGNEEINEVLAALRRIDESKAPEAKEEMFDVVRRGRRPTVATGTRKLAVVADGSTAVTGANMWALLSDDDPGHGGARPAKRGKKTKTKKKNAAGASNQVDTVDDEETPGSTPSELEVEMNADFQMIEDEEENFRMIEDEEERTEKVAAGGSRCRTVASRVCRAALAVLMFALFFQFVSTSPSDA